MPSVVSPPLSPSNGTRRSQQERRDGTQRKLIEATLACLSELGHARTTTTEIVRAAGVSQGALFKHFPSKAELLAASVEFLFEELVSGYQQTFAALPIGKASPSAAFELLWSIFTGPRLAIAFELYMVARTDPALQRCLEPVVRRHRAMLVERARDLFPSAAASHADFDAWIDLLMCAMEGLVIERYGAGDVTGPALTVLKRLWLDTLMRAERTPRPRARR
jgi:AcrR family transcriptional regulator